MSSTTVTWPGLHRKPVADTDEDPEQMPSWLLEKPFPKQQALSQPLASQAEWLGQRSKETQELTVFQNSHYCSQIYLDPTKTVDPAPTWEDGSWQWPQQGEEE